ncbi:MAG: nucleotidyltransferase family protein [Planctomycetota bacterium]|jgi:molybdenum cofactor cytidylyltransferase
MICSIVLAAGMSRRMGVQKLLLPFDEKTVIGRIVDELAGATVDKIHVVVGCEGERVVEELSGRKVLIVENPDYEEGMLSSVRAGIRSLPEECECVLVALGDQPAITSELVDELVKAFVETEKGILTPLYNGKRGHPLLFSQCYCDEVLECYDDIGLRGLLHAHPEDVFELSVSSSAVLSDIDYPEDYRRISELSEENK